MINLFPKPRPDFHISPNRFERLPERKRSVTIVAGFKCSDGVVLCSDTQETVHEYLKRDSPKLEVRPAVLSPVPLKIAFASAGHAAFANKLVEDMWGAANNVAEQGGDIGQICAALEAASRETHETFWKIYPSDDRPKAHFVFAVAASGRVELFDASGPIITPIDKYDCEGIGVIFAKYLADPLYRTNMTCRQAAMLSVYVLTEVKDHVEGCGGNSQILILKNNGSHGWLDSVKLAATVTNIRSFKGYSDHVMLSTVDLEVPDEQIEKLLTNFGKTARKFRVQQKKYVDEYWKAIERIFDEL